MRGAISLSIARPGNVQIDPITTARTFNLMWNRSPSSAATPSVEEITADVIGSPPPGRGIRNTPKRTAARTPAAAPINVLLGFAPAAAVVGTGLLSKNLAAAKETVVTPIRAMISQRPSLAENRSNERSNGAWNRVPPTRAAMQSVGSTRAPQTPGPVREQQDYSGQQGQHCRNRREYLHVLGLPWCRGEEVTDGNASSQHSCDRNEVSLAPGAGHPPKRDNRDCSCEPDYDREQYTADPDGRQDD